MTASTPPAITLSESASSSAEAAASPPRRRPSSISSRSSRSRRAVAAQLGRETTGARIRARARDDVRPDPGGVALGPVGETLEQVPRHRQPEHAVAEELEALVRLRAVPDPGGGGERLVPGGGGKCVDQPAEGPLHRLWISRSW